MRLITTDGVIGVAVATRQDRETVSRHANAVARFLATGEVEPLEPFEGLQVEGHKLEADPDRLESWATANDLEFEDLYEASGR